MNEKSEEKLISKQDEKFKQEKYSQIEEKQRQTHPEVGEDATQYGEFVSSYFAWVSLPKQKEKAEEMAEMTQKNKRELSPNCQRAKKGPSPNCQRAKKGPSPNCPQLSKEEKR